VSVDASDRGQVVVLAGVAVALALLALLAAALQLGYHDDVTAEAVEPHPAADAQRALERATRAGTRPLRGDFAWRERSTLVRQLRDRLRPRLDALESAALERNTAYAVSLNRTAASRWVADHCPGGPGREFGPCVAREGVALQRRGDRATVLAVAFDLNVATTDGDGEFTLVVNATG
jgi:hypothetical protein